MNRDARGMGGVTVRPILAFTLLLACLGSSAHAEIFVIGGTPWEQAHPKEAFQRFQAETRHRQAETKLDPNVCQVCVQAPPPSGEELRAIRLKEQFFQTFPYFPINR